MARKEATKERTVYLLMGEEDFLVEERLGQLLERLVPPEEREWNLDTFYADEIPIQEIIDRVDTLPFLGTRRVVVLKRVEELSAQDQERLAAYLEGGKLPSTLVLVTQGLDKRRRLFLVARKVGEVLEFPRLSSRSLLPWVKARVQKEGKGISDEVAMTLIALVGNSLRELASEVEKLVNYVGERRRITVEDIQEVCTRAREVTIFQLVDAIGNREMDKALGLLQEVLREGEAPPLVLYMIARQFRRILQAKILLNRGVSVQQLPQELGVAPFLALRYAEQAGKFPHQEVQEAFTRLLEADVAMKSGVQSPALALELAIVDLCRGVSRL